MHRGEEENGATLTPPRRRFVSEQVSDHTASVDWKPLNLSEPTTGDSVSMQSVMREKDEKEKIDERRRRRSRVPGHPAHRTRRKGHHPPAYPPNTHKERLTKLFYTSLIILLISFLINGAFVSYGYYKLTRIQYADLTIHRMEISRLAEEHALFTLRAELPRKWYFSLFNLVVREGTLVEASIPDIIKTAERKTRPLISARLPHRVEIGRGSKGIELAVPFTINHDVPLKDLVGYFIRPTPTPKRLEFNVSFSIQTASYWVPISFGQTISSEYYLPLSSSSSRGPGTPTIEGLEFADGGSPEQFALKVFVGYPKSLIPKYLFIHLPELRLDIAHHTGDESRDPWKNSFAEISVLEHVLRHDRLGDELGNLPVRVVCGAGNVKAMVALLEKVRDRQWDWSILVGAKPGLLHSSSLSYLQRWLTTFDLRLDMAQIKEQMGRASDGKKAPRRRGIRERAAISVGLTAIKNASSGPQFVTKVSVDLAYLGELLFGADLSLFRGILPAIKVRSVVGKQANGNKPVTICTIDLVHKHSEDRTKVEFEIRTEVEDVSPFVEAGHKALESKRLEALKDGLREYQMFLVEVIGDRILDQLIRVFEMEFTFTNGGGLYFRRGPRVPLSFAADPTAPVKRARRVKHDCYIEMSTDGSSIESLGRIRFPQAPAFDDKTFVNIYWVDMDFSLLPWESGSVDGVELFRFKVDKGRAMMLLSPMNPLQMLFRGSFSYALTISDTKSQVHDRPSVIAAWQYMVESYTNGGLRTSPKIRVVGRIEKNQLQFPVTLPARSYFVSEEEKKDLPLWVTDTIKTRVKIAGFHEGMLQFLLELPSFGRCDANKRKDYLTALKVSISLPAVHGNGCIYPKHGKHEERIACVAQVGLHPLVLSFDLIDGQLCDITTRLATTNVLPTLASRHRPLLDEMATEAANQRDGDSLINFLPLDFRITDLSETFEMIDGIVGGTLRTIKTSLGFNDRETLSSEDVTLLDRLFNGVGQMFPLSLPLHSETPRPRTRPPVTKLLKDESLNIFVDIESESRTDMKGRIIFDFPKKCVGSRGSAKKAAAANKLESLALLLAVQWGRTLMMAKFQRSWVQARVSQGQLTFRFDENRVRLDDHHEVPSTSLIVIEFAVHADTPNFSTATLRRVISLVHAYWSEMGDPHTIRRLKERMPKSSLEIEIQTEPYSTADDLQADSFYKKKSRGRGDNKDALYPTTAISPKFKFTQDLPLGLILQFGLRVVERVREARGRPLGKKSKTSNPAMVIRPRGDPRIEEYRFPCIIPGMCVGTRDYKLLQPGPFLVAEISIFDAIQPALDWMAELTGRLLDKLNFRSYPELLVIRIRLSQINLAVAVNDMDTIEVELEPITITRAARIVYPELPVSKALDKARDPDMEQFLARIRLSPKIGIVGDILHAYSFDVTMGKTVASVPHVTVRDKNIPVHYSPLNVSLTTERLKNPSMLSTFITIALRETAVAPVPYTAPGSGGGGGGGGGGGPGMKLVKTSREQMDLRLDKIGVPNPISFASIVIDTPITYRYFYKGYEFVRVYLSNFVLHPGTNLLNAHVTVSRTAFGQNPNPGAFFPEFSEFLAGMAMGQKLQTTAVINMGDDFQVVWDMSFPPKPPSTGVFNQQASTLWSTQIHDYLHWTVSLGKAPFRLSKSALQKLVRAPAAAMAWAGSLKDWLAGSAKDEAQEKRLHKRGDNENAAANVREDWIQFEDEDEDSEESGDQGGDPRERDGDSAPEAEIEMESAIRVEGENGDEEEDEDKANFVSCDEDTTNFLSWDEDRTAFLSWDEDSDGSSPAVGVESILSPDEIQSQRDAGIMASLRRGMSYVTSFVGSSSPHKAADPSSEDGEQSSDDILTGIDVDGEEPNDGDYIDPTDVVVSKHFEDDTVDHVEDVIKEAKAAAPVKNKARVTFKETSPPTAANDIIRENAYERSRHLTLDELVTSLADSHRKDGPPGATTEVAARHKRLERLGRHGATKFKRTIDLENPNTNNRISADWKRRVQLVRRSNFMHLPSQTNGAALMKSRVLVVDPDVVMARDGLSNPGEHGPPSASDRPGDEDDEEEDLIRLPEEYNISDRGRNDPTLGFWARWRYVYYVMAFQNTYDLGLMFPGMMLNIVLKDPYGLSGGKDANSRDLMARLILAPSNCLRTSLSEQGFLKCLGDNTDSAPVRMLPKPHPSAETRAKAAVTLMNSDAIVPVIRSIYQYDGLCVDIAPSVVVVGMFMPEEEEEAKAKAKGEKREPFLMEVLMSLENQEAMVPPCADPCRKCLACIPGPSAEQFKGFVVRNFRPKEKGGALLNGKEDLNDVYRSWSRQAVPANMNLVIRFQFRMEAIGKPVAGAARSGWALVFRKGQPQKAKKATDYGYVGIEDSFAIVCDPVQKGLYLYRNGEAPPLLTKTTAFPRGITRNKWFSVMIQYRVPDNEKNAKGERNRPGQKVLIVSMWPVREPQNKSVAVFPINVKDIGSSTQSMHIGFTSAVGHFARVSMRDFSIGAPIPDLSNTRIYYMDARSTLPGGTGRFLLELRDSCGRVMPVCPVGLKVELRPVHSKEAEEADADESLFAPPESKPVRCKVVELVSSDVYLVSYVAPLPGRYHIYVSMRRRPQNLLDGDPVNRLYWHRVKHNHIYVRHVW